MRRYFIILLSGIRNRTTLCSAGLQPVSGARRHWRQTGATIVLSMVLAVRALAFEAGAAKVEITPPLGTPLNGYLDRYGRGATSVHDPVWARCLYLDDGATKVLLVNADLCIINPELRAKVLKLAPPEVPRENIILTATHTHSAQGGMVKALPFRAISGRFMPEVLDATAKKIAEAMAAACAARQRATIGYGTTAQQGLSVNRRHDGGPVDEQIGVIRVEDADGNAIAIVANFAAHPTTVPEADRYAISADYPGYYYAALERLSHEKCVAMFLNGAAGDQRCGNPEKKEGWARTESIGNLLAARVKGLANEIACSEAKLHVGYAEPLLPPTLAKSLLPATTVVQTLEIIYAADKDAGAPRDLLLTFFPGEPGVEIGLELRRRALQRGYAAQFSVALANDHLLYFVSASHYAHLEYESCATVYGPRIENWLYREFSKLMTRGEAEPALEAPVAPKVEPLGDGARIVLSGTPYAIGYQRGSAFAQALAQTYEKKVAAELRSGRLSPRTGLWKLLPPFIDPVPIALPQLGIGARPLLAGLPAEVFDEIAGMADGAGLPFDAVWLVQCAPTYAARSASEGFYRAPFCTMFAAIGDKAGADDLLIGRNLDWPDDEPPVILDIQPTTGRRFVQVGFEWNAGVFTGMNDAGLVLCAERVETLGEPSLDGPPIELLLRSILQTAGKAADALATLQSYPHLRGYHVLAASPGKSDAQVIEFGVTPVVRGPRNGLLLGVDPDAHGVAPNAQARYARVNELLAKERIVDAAEIQTALQDAAAGGGQASVFNGDTRYSVVFEPRARAMRVAFRTPQGGLGEFTTVSLAEAKSKGGKP